MHVVTLSKRAGGFTYLGILFAIAIMGVALALAGQLWSTLERRAKEQQLLFIGAQIQDAIERYYAGAPSGTQQRYPSRLDDLLRDRRYPDIRRYLRKIYPDPLTGKGDWGIIRGADGGIAAVFSTAAGVPLKAANFGHGYQFGQAKSYAEWIFRAQVSEQAVLPPPPGRRAAEAGRGGATPGAVP